MDERLQRLQGHRLKMAVLSIFNVLFQGGVMALFAWVGTIPVWPVVAFFAVSASTTVVFALIVRSNLNLRMKDQNLLTTQIVVNSLVQIVFLILVPQIAVTFLVALLVIFVYAAVLYTPRQYTVSWIVFSIVTGAAIYFVRDRFGYPGTSGPEIAIIWLFFCLALRRLMLASSQYSSLRAKLSEKNAALQASLARIEELASHDELTGCFNRRRLGEMLCDELRRAGRTSQGFAFAILDLDHFKSVNDRYGHPAGDAVLKKASKAAIVRWNGKTTRRVSG
ncbi:MAG TPA: diguanylate cyclase [Noviherbaspirillum sp.]